MDITDALHCQNASKTLSLYTVSKVLPKACAHTLSNAVAHETRGLEQGSTPLAQGMQRTKEVERAGVCQQMAVDLLDSATEDREPPASRAGRDERLGWGMRGEG